MPNHISTKRAPRSAYKWYLRLAKREGLSGKAARQAAMTRMNLRYNTRPKHTDTLPFTWKQPKGWAHRWWCGDLKQMRLSMKKTKQELLRENSLKSNFEWRVEKLKALMDQLIIAKKRGEDIAPYVQEGERISTLTTSEQHQECFSRRLRVPTPGKTLAAHSKRHNDAISESKTTQVDNDEDDTFLQFYLEITTSEPVVSEEVFHNDFAPQALPVSLSAWDLPPISPENASEAVGVEKYLDDALP